MLQKDFSQLPVMNGERKVKGMVSWRSIGMRLALGVKCAEVRECMENSPIRNADTSLLDAIDEILKHQYVLIRDRTERISGIVTTSDLSMQFRQLSEPFLLLAEVENHVRRLISMGEFSVDELRGAADPRDGARKLNTVSDLTFGEYIKLLDNSESWSRQIRNDVMHFDPDGITEEDLDTLRTFAAFLRRLWPMLRPRATVS